MNTMGDRTVRGTWKTRPAIVAAGVMAAVFVVAASRGEAQASSKEECLEAHSRGQDLRDAGRLTTARTAFIACAQASCPQLIQADCARFGEELDRLVPTVSFAARDANGGDLPDTSVAVDDMPIAARLDDGKAYDLDPGRHAVKFTHDGHDAVVTVVLTQGERGRSVIANFPDVGVDLRRAAAVPPAVAQPHRPIGPLFVAGAGAVAAVTGVVLAIAGMKQVPSDCSLGSHQCVAAPGDPSFDQAHRGVTLANVGIGVGIGGAAVLAGGTFWYFAQPLKLPKEVGQLSPWLGDHTTGLAMHGRF
jgi:hypothetical protein